MRAFTLKSNPAGLMKAIISPCIVKKVKSELQGQFNGLWDTGATSSVITKKIATELGLAPIGKADVRHAGGSGTADMYLVDIILPNQVNVQSVTVIEGILYGFDLLIGMDIITLGDLSITNHKGNTTFTFCIPSRKEVDFVKEIDKQTILDRHLKKGRSSTPRSKSKKRRRPR